MKNMIIFNHNQVGDIQIRGALTTGDYDPIDSLIECI